LIAQAVTELKSKTISQKVKGIDDLAKVFKSIASDIQLCQADSKDDATLAKIVKYLETFPDIKSFTKHVNGDISVNKVQIGFEQGKLIYYYELGDYANVGYEAALMFDRIIIGSNKVKLGQDGQELGLYWKFNSWN